MPRKKRIICPNYCYHVMMRGVGGRRIFDDDKDKARFCLLLQYASEICKFNIHGFCLMDNHIHLLLEPLTKEFSSGMHRLAFRYAQYYNKKVERQGYLFQSRYKAVIVQHGIYLRRLIRYIHRNPIRANLVGDLLEYPWSSHRAYNGESDFTWLKKDFVLSLFGSEPYADLESFNYYAKLDDDQAKIELNEIRNSTDIGAYGNVLFIEEFQNEFQFNPDLGLNKCAHVVSFEILIKVISCITNISLDEMQTLSKERQLVDARAILTWLYLKFQLGTINDLTVLLQRDPTSVVRLKQRVQRSPKLLQLADEIISKLEIDQNGV